MRSWSFFQFSNCNVTKRSFVSRFLSRIGTVLNTDQLERFVELLQVIDEQVCPRPVDRLLLADDSFFKIKTALSPAENLCHRGLAFDRTEHGMSHRTLLEIDLAVAATGFKSETPAPLA